AHAAPPERLSPRPMSAPPVRREAPAPTPVPPPPAAPVRSPAPAQAAPPARFPRRARSAGPGGVGPSGPRSRSGLPERFSPPPPSAPPVRPSLPERFAPRPVPPSAPSEYRPPVRSARPAPSGLPERFSRSEWYDSPEPRSAWPGRRQGPGTPDRFDAPQSYGLTDRSDGAYGDPRPVAAPRHLWPAQGGRPADRRVPHPRTHWSSAQVP